MIARSLCYAESSAVLAWLLGESGRTVTVSNWLNAAGHILSSDLTLIECRRGVIRALYDRRISEREGQEALGRLQAVSAAWDLFELTPDVAERASAPLPHDPVRTLDAIHLATAALAQDQLGPITFLSFDHRVRASARALGMIVPTHDDR